MHDSTVSNELPTPEQMRNYFAAERSAMKTRQLRECSRAIIIGNIAAAICVFESFLVIQHAGWLNGEDGSGSTGRMIVMDFIVFGFLFWMILSVRSWRRKRSTNSVYVLSRTETNLQQITGASSRRRVIVLFVFWFIFQATGTVLFMFAFNHLSNSAILVALSIGPLIATSLFAGRFVIFRLWEDLLFSCAVALAWIPFLFQAWHLAAMSIIAFPMILIGTISLHYRWVRWQSLSNAESNYEEVKG